MFNWAFSYVCEPPWLVSYRMDQFNRPNSDTTPQNEQQLGETDLKLFIMKEAPPPRNLSNTNLSSLSSLNLTERETSSSPIV